MRASRERIARRNEGPPRPRCIRREWKALGPSCVSPEGDDEGLVSFEGFDQCQTVLPRDRQGGGKSVRQTEIGSADGCRRHTCTGSFGVRIDQVGAALGGARCGDGVEELDRAGKMSRHLGVDNADPEWFWVVSAPEARDVSGCVHHGAHHVARGELGERALRRPTLHVPSRIDPTWHRPRIEPTARELPCNRASFEDLCHLVRGLLRRDLPPTQATHWAVWFPRAEHGVDTMEDRPCSGETERDARFNRTVLRVQVDSDYGSHDRFAMMHGSWQLDGPVGRRPSTRHAKPSLLSADCSDCSNPALV